MKLIDNWRDELNRLWSVKLVLLSTLLLNLPDLVNFFQDWLDPYWFKLLATLAGLACFAARFIKQEPPTNG